MELTDEQWAIYAGIVLRATLYGHTPSRPRRTSPGVATPPYVECDSCHQRASIMAGVGEPFGWQCGAAVSLLTVTK